MCKIAVISNITDETSDNAWKFIKQMSKDMTFSDDDGFGYAAMGQDGKLFGERWKNVKECFSVNKSASLMSQEVITKFKGFLKTKPSVLTYNSFGEVNDKPLRSAILHARKATSPNVFENVHPFISGDTVLIHNGVIHNTQELVMKTSTCDSETILHEYLKQDVVNDMNNIQRVADHLQGYYACGVFSKQRDGRLILDVFRDSGAKLHAYFIQELNSIVIATPTSYSSYNNDAPYGPVPSACRSLNFTIVDHYEVEESTITRIDALTGEVIETMSFDSTYKETSSKASKHTHQANRRKNNVQDHGYCDASEKWSSLFGGHGTDKRQELKKLNDREKDDTLDRMLNDVMETDYQDINNDTPPASIIQLPEKIKTAEEVVTELTQDFIKDEGGVWHRRGTGTDRTK